MLVAGLLRDTDRGTRAEDAYEEAMLALHGAPPEVIATVAEVSPAAREFIASVEVTRPLSAGDVLIAGGHELEVALSPGHSPTDTVFVAREGWALVADHLLADRPSVTMAHRPPDGSPDPRERPPALVRYRESLAKTAALGLRLAYPGHWNRVDDPAASVAARLVLQDQRAARILRELAGGSGDGLGCGRVDLGALCSGRQRGSSALQGLHRPLRRPRTPRPAGHRRTRPGGRRRRRDPLRGGVARHQLGEPRLGFERGDTAADPVGHPDEPGFLDVQVVRLRRLLARRRLRQPVRDLDGPLGIAEVVRRTR